MTSGDKEAEAKVDERLLISFRQILSWSSVSLSTAVTDKSQEGGKIDINDNVERVSHW